MYKPKEMGLLENGEVAKLFSLRVSINSSQLVTATGFCYFLY